MAIQLLGKAAVRLLDESRIANVAWRKNRIDLVVVRKFGLRRF